MCWEIWHSTFKPQDLNHPIVHCPSTKKILCGHVSEVICVLRIPIAIMLKSHSLGAGYLIEKSFCFVKVVSID